MPIHYTKDYGHRQIFIILFERICEDSTEVADTLVSHYASLIAGDKEEDERAK
jgi:hypothetical protein